MGPQSRPDSDVLAQMDFKPIVRSPKTMDAGLFREKWGGLAEALKHARPLPRPAA